jgi:hypothetical protein
VEEVKGTAAARSFAAGCADVMKVPPKEMRPYLAVLVCFPLALLYVNDSWVFLKPETWIDPFLYTGYFMELKQHLNTFPTEYYSSRLPWLLLGSFFHSLAPPAVANYLLRLSLFYTATFSLYATLRILFHNDLAATIAALALGAHAYFLWAIGWDYVDGMGIVLIFIVTACLTVGATVRGWRILLICAGAAAASMLSCYVMLVLLLPFQVGWYLLLNSYRRRNGIVASLLLFTSGAVAAFAAYGAIDYWLCGQFLYLRPQIAKALSVGADPTRWKAPDYGWIAVSTWLVLPAIALVLSLVLLTSIIYRRARGATISDLDRAAALTALMLAGIESMFFAMEMKGFWLLQYSFYANYLMPYVFLVIGAALAVATAHIRKRLHFLVIATVAVVLLAPFLLTSTISPVSCAPLCKLSGRVGWTAAAGCLLLTSAILSRRTWPATLALLILGVWNIMAADRRVFSFPSSAADRSLNLMVFDAMPAIRPYNQDGKLRFWYNNREALGNLFRAVACTHLWSYRLINEDFPSRTVPRNSTYGALALGQTAVTLSSQKDSNKLLEQSLAEIGAKPELLGSAHIQRGGDGFDMTFFRCWPLGAHSGIELSMAPMTSYPPYPLVRTAAQHVVVRASAAPWAFAAQLPMGSIGDRWRDCSAMVKLNAQVQRGLIGLGILDQGQKDFLSRLPVQPTAIPIDIILQIPKLGNASTLIVQAWDSGNEGTIQINSVAVSPYACPEGR